MSLSRFGALLALVWLGAIVVSYIIVHYEWQIAVGAACLLFGGGLVIAWRRRVSER